MQREPECDVAVCRGLSRRAKQEGTRASELFAICEAFKKNPAARWNFPREIHLLGSIPTRFRELTNEQRDT